MAGCTFPKIRAGTSSLSFKTVFDTVWLLWFLPRLLIWLWWLQLHACNICWLTLALSKISGLKAKMLPKRGHWQPQALLAVCECLSALLQGPAHGL